MKSQTRNVPSSLSRVPSGRLVGHDGPIQAVRFTGTCVGGQSLLYAFGACFFPLMKSSRAWTEDPLGEVLDETGDFLHFDLRVDGLIWVSSLALNEHSTGDLLRCNSPRCSRSISLYTGDGKYCVTGGHDRTVRLWNPARLDPAFPPGPTIAAASQSSTVDGIPMSAIPRALPIQVYSDGISHPVAAVCIDESSSTLAIASDKTLVVTDVVTQQTKRRLQEHVGRINAVAISNDSQVLISASYDATVRIWDGRSRSNQPIQVLKEAKDSVTGVHIVQDDVQALIRSSSVDGIVRTYDLRKGVVHCDDNFSPITGMAPTYDGQCLATTCLDGCIRLMEIDSGELLNTYENGHRAGQYGLECCVTANDAYIVSGSEDGKAVIYDLVRAACVQTLSGHSKPVCSIAAHPKREHGHVLITASYDGTAVMWAHDEDYIRWQ